MGESEGGEEVGLTLLMGPPTLAGVEWRGRRRRQSRTHFAHEGRCYPRGSNIRNADRQSVVDRSRGQRRENSGESGSLSWADSEGLW
jgi:hypothetical protein